MKKIVAAAMALCMTGAVIPAAYPQTAEQAAAEDVVFDPVTVIDPLNVIGKPLEDYPDRLLGDADNDGFITPYDASTVLEHYSKLSMGKSDDISDETAAAMDADPTDKIDSSDAVHILRYCIKRSACTTDAYADALVSGHQNKEIAYDPAAFKASSRYVDPDDSVLMPVLAIDKKEISADDIYSGKVTVNINVSHAEGAYSSAGVHLIYDDRLTLDNLMRPEEKGSKPPVVSHQYIDKGNEFIGLMGPSSCGQDGVLMAATFILPEDAQPGDLYPIGVKYCEDERTFDCFGGYKNDDQSKLMTSYLFTRGIENGYIRIAGDEEGTTVEEQPTGDYNVTENGITYKVMSDRAVVVTASKELSGEVVIPDTIEGKPVLQICSGAFKNCTGITSLTMPDSVETISDSAFSGCSALSEIVFSSAVSNIEGNVFEGTAWLGKKRAEDPIVVVNGILVDGKACSGDVVIPDNVTFISSCAFAGCEDIVSVKIPDSVRTINWGAFSNCTALKKVDMGFGYVALYSKVFSGCTSLESVTLPVEITSLNLYLFENCESLREITVPASVKTIYAGVFKNCPLEKVAIVNRDCKIMSPDALGDAEIHSYVGGEVEHWAEINGKVFVPLSDVNTMAPSTLKGDANLDDNVNIADAVLVMQVATNPDKYAPGKTEFSITPEGEQNADVDGKPGLSNMDALMIQKFKLGLITSFD